MANINHNHLFYLDLQINPYFWNQN